MFLTDVDVDGAYAFVCKGQKKVFYLEIIFKGEQFPGMPFFTFIYASNLLNFKSTIKINNVS